MDFGYRVTVFGFRRERYNTAYRPPWPNVPLGFTSDARYWHRVRALLGAIPAVFAHRDALSRAAVFYARNIDQLLLALLARLIAFSRAPVVYEVLDIPAILMRRGPVPTLLRAIERLCLRRTSLLVLSSPGFHRNYYKAVQKYRGDWFLLENKLHPSISSLARRRRSGARQRAPALGGWLFRSDPRRVHVRPDHPAGRTPAGPRPVQVRRHPDDRRSGEVRRGPAALSEHRLSRSLPAAAGSRRPLPRRRFRLGARPRAHRPQFALVDALPFLRIRLFGIPCLAVHGFEVGNTIERHRIGWTFDAPLEESLVRFFEQLTPAAYEHIRGRLRSVPRTMFVAGEDVAGLCAILDSASATPQRRRRRRLIMTQSNSTSLSALSRLTG